MGIGIYLTHLIVMALACSAAAMTITKASLFSTLRDWVVSKNAWLGKLVTCPYCTSHWLAMAAALLTPAIPGTHPVSHFVVTAFAIVAITAPLCRYVGWAMVHRDFPAEIDQLQKANEALRVNLGKAKAVIENQQQQLAEYSEGNE